MLWYSEVLLGSGKYPNESCRWRFFAHAKILYGFVYDTGLIDLDMKIPICAGQ